MESHNLYGKKKQIGVPIIYKLLFCNFYICCFRPLPSGFGKRLKRVKENSAKQSTVKRKCTRSIVYERDIILLPLSYSPDSIDGKIPIPRSERDTLAANSLIGKITLDSSMTEDEIFDEIRDIFQGPMKNNEFKFDILHTTGGGSKTLVIPAVSKHFRWTASSVAGKNAKTPVYILAREELKVFINYVLLSVYIVNYYFR